MRAWSGLLPTKGSDENFTVPFLAVRVIGESAMFNDADGADRNDLDDRLFGWFQRCHVSVKAGGV